MKRILLLALPIALLAACTAADKGKTITTASETAAAPSTLDANVLTANHWLLDDASDGSGARIDGLFVRADKPLTLDFGDGRLSVANTCNRMGGSYGLSGDTLTVAPLASTMMACADEALMALDQAAGKRLEGTLKVRRLDPSTLVLTTAGGDMLRFRGEPTAETRYGGEGETVFLDIDAETVPCSSGVMQAQCLQVREVHYDGNGLEQGKRGAYENFHGSIEGYEHQPGVRNVLRVKRYTVKNPPADASSLAYVLDMVVSSETVQQP